MTKGPVIASFAALFPLEINIMAYSFFGILELPFIVLIFFLIIAGFLQLVSMIPRHGGNEDEPKVQKQPSKEKKIEKEKPSWVNGKCPNCGHFAFLIKGGASENLVCQNCGYEFNKI
jgi:ribosomal protein S27AE